jgi:hypothetical protein
VEIHFALVAKSLNIDTAHFNKKSGGGNHQSGWYRLLAVTNGSI